jgi:hypothetical protein
MKIAYSVDGITWTAKSHQNSGNITLNAVAHGNGTFVAVGSTTSGGSPTAKAFYSSGN